MPFCINKVKNSKITLEKAENIMLEFIQNYVPKNSCPLAGNSVYMDRLFLNKYMKRFNQHLHYRIIDVSTIKELNFRWFPGNTEIQKKLNHRALDDIKNKKSSLLINNIYSFLFCLKLPIKSKSPLKNNRKIVTNDNLSKK